MATPLGAVEKCSRRLLSAFRSHHDPQQQHALHPAFQVFMHKGCICMTAWQCHNIAPHMSLQIDNSAGPSGGAWVD